MHIILTASVQLALVFHTSAIANKAMNGNNQQAGLDEKHGKKSSSPSPAVLEDGPSRIHRTIIHAALERPPLSLCLFFNQQGLRKYIFNIALGRYFVLS